MGIVTDCCVDSILSSFVVEERQQELIVQITKIKFIRLSISIFIYFCINRGYSHQD